MENKTIKVLQRVESNVTPYVSLSYILGIGLTLKVTLRVKKDVISIDVPYDEETINDVDTDESITIRRTKKQIKKFKWLTKYMVVAYALLFVDNDISNSFS